jgi:membrane-bound ClpP family serine protease
MYVTSGIICAILSLIIVPEIFGALAIVFGAYAWKKEEGNRGLYVIIIGIVCMIVGIYFTSLFELGDLIPSSSSNSSAMNLALLIFN